MGLSDCCKSLDTTKEDCCAVVGWINVNADGTTDFQCGGAGSSRTAVGTYTLTPPPGAQTVQLTVIEALGTRDSIEIHPIDFIGTQVHVSEGDNGTAANVLQDRAFQAVWYGTKSLVTDVELV